MENCAKPLLTLSGYGVSYGRKVVLASIDLALSRDSVNVLMGPVKAGKSTLMRALSGQAEGNRVFRQWGDALLGGMPLGGAVRPMLVAQHAPILNASVRDALVFHCSRDDETLRSPRARDEFVRAQLQEFGLEHLIGHLDSSMLSLPIDIQRTINIMSHALAQPSLLLIDEPTYGLDDLAAERLIEWISSLKTKVCLLVTLHHQGQARRLADRVILLGGGRILADEPVQRFFSAYGNPWVDQFVRTGSLFIASPDAKPEELSADVEPPPPLPAAALAAIREFVESEGMGGAAEAVAPTSVQPAAVPELPRDGQVLPVARPSESPSATSSIVSAPPPDSLPPRAGWAVPPRTSRQGVIDASLVGKAIPSAQQGPTGFHWIIFGKMAGCSEPGLIHPIDYDLDLLRRCGVTYLVTLTERDLDQEALARNGLKNLHLPIFDREAPSMAQAYMLVYRMQQLLDEGHVLTVHCKAGIGRTGTMIACWLIREGGLTASDAITRLRAINPRYVQTVVQEEFLADFEQDILMRLY